MGAEKRASTRQKAPRNAACGCEIRREMGLPKSGEQKPPVCGHVSAISDLARYLWLWTPGFCHQSKTCLVGMIAIYLYPTSLQC